MTLATIAKIPGDPLNAAIQRARDELRCACQHKNVSHGYGDDAPKTWRDGSRIGLGPCGMCGCQAFKIGGWE